MRRSSTSKAVTCRLIDYRKEGPQGLFDLFENVYGDAGPLIARWHWQYMDHPRRNDVQVLVAEHEGRIVGWTSHFPMDLMIEGKVVECYHGSGSMIHTEFRRMGIMESLVEKRSATLPLYYGRGVAPAMFKLLLKHGYREVEPSKYMVAVVSPVRWLMRKLKLFEANGILADAEHWSDGGFTLVDRCGDEFDRFFKRVAPHYPAIVIKDAAYMNWRYVDQPQRTYQVLYRRDGEQILSVAVLRATEHAAHIVDLIWDPRNADDPAKTIRLMKEYVKRSGFTNLYCWGTLAQLRETLQTNGFITMTEPHLCGVHTHPDLLDRAADAGLIHFVDGDGDYEFLE